jgi:hypothetical protein
MAILDINSTHRFLLLSKQTHFAKGKRRRFLIYFLQIVIETESERNKESKEEASATGRLVQKGDLGAFMMI